MMRLKSALCTIAITTGTLHAGEPAATTSGLTLVPFAVPVAVPVAVVQQPTLFYGVTRFAVPGDANSTPPAVAPIAEPVHAPDDAALREQVAAILQRRCAECHQGSQARGEVVLFDATGRFPLKLPRQAIVEATEATAAGAPAMPPGGREKLSGAEWNILKQWARLPKSFVY